MLYGLKSDWDIEPYADRSTATRPYMLSIYDIPCPDTGGRVYKCITNIHPASELSGALFVG